MKLTIGRGSLFYRISIDVHRGPTNKYVLPRAVIGLIETRAVLYMRYWIIGGEEKKELAYKSVSDGYRTHPALRSARAVHRAKYSRCSYRAHRAGCSISSISRFRRYANLRTVCHIIHFSLGAVCVRRSPPVWPRIYRSSIREAPSSRLVPCFPWLVRCILECLLIIIIRFTDTRTDARARARGADITFTKLAPPLRTSETTFSGHGWADLPALSPPWYSLPLLSRLISLRRSPSNMLTRYTNVYVRANTCTHSTHTHTHAHGGVIRNTGKVTPIPNAMEINDINNFAPYGICALSDTLLNFLLWMRAGTLGHARVRICTPMHIHVGYH